MWVVLNGNAWRPVSIPRFAGDRPLHLPLVVPVAKGLSLVVGGLALGQADLDLDLALLEVHLERDQGEALLGDLTGDPVDLTTVEEQLAVLSGSWPPSRANS